MRKRPEVSTVETLSPFFSAAERRERKGLSLRNHSGVVLLMVLFIIVLLVTMVIEFDYQTRIEFKSTLRFVNTEKAVSLARSGLLAGEEILRQNLSDSYDGPDQFWAQAFPPYPLGDGSVSLKIEDENGKIDVNLLNQLKTAREGSEAQIRKLFALLEIDTRLVDEIISWMACENDFYYQGLFPSYTCQNKHPLETLSELRLVRGMTDEIYSRISPYLTLYPQSADGGGKININTADLIVLQTLYYKKDSVYFFDVSKDLAEEIIRSRPIKNVNDLASVPGFKTIGEGLKLWSTEVKSSYFTLISSGEVKGTRKKMTEAIARPVKGSKKIDRYYTRLE